MGGDLIAFAAVVFVWLLAGGIGVGMSGKTKDITTAELKAGILSGPIVLGVAIGVRLQK